MKSSITVTRHSGLLRDPVRPSPSLSPAGIAPLRMDLTVAVLKCARASSHINQRNRVPVLRRASRHVTADLTRDTARLSKPLQRFSPPDARNASVTGIAIAATYDLVKKVRLFSLYFLFRLDSGLCVRRAIRCRGIRQR